MNILKKLATPFIALWRWIKETAWVQPLLIVGVIFGIIFSIPYISQGIQGLINQSESHIKYFEKNMLSLEGSKIGEENSEANHFFEAFNDAQEKWVNNDKEGAKTALKQYSKENKFFLFFVQEECSNCETLKEGSEYLENNWSNYIGLDGKTYPSYSYQSINVAETFDDDEYYEEEDKKPIDDLVGSKSYLEFYRSAMAMVDIQPYYINMSNSDSTKATELITNTTGLNDSSKMQTPTTFLIDLTEQNTTNNIISTIFYSVGSDKLGATETLANAWMGTEDFENKLINQ